MRFALNPPLPARAGRKRFVRPPDLTSQDLNAMNRFHSLLPLFILLFSFLSPATAQQAPEPESEKAPLQGIYDPENPNADADGFIWTESQTTNDGPETKDQRPKTKERAPQPSAVQSSAASTSADPSDAGQANPQSEIHNPQSPPSYLANYYGQGQAPESQAAPVRQGSLTSMFVQMLGGLGIVAGLFILGSVLLKRISAKGGLLGSRGRIWQVIEGVPLGPKRYLYVTRFVDRLYLLAATEQQVTLLGEISDPTIVSAVEAGDDDFRRFLVPESLASQKRPPASRTEPVAEEPSEALFESPAAPEPGQGPVAPPRPRTSRPTLSRSVTV